MWLDLLSVMSLKSGEKIRLASDSLSRDQTKSAGGWVDDESDRCSSRETGLEDGRESIPTNVHRKIIIQIKEKVPGRKQKNGWCAPKKNFCHV